MKRKFNYQKLSLTVLALSLALLGGNVLPDSAPENPKPFRPVIEEGNPSPENSEGEGINPLSDLDEREQKIEF